VEIVLPLFMFEPQLPSAMVICARCGKEVTEDAAFCRNCGADLRTQVAARAPPIAPTSSSSAIGPGQSKLTRASVVSEVKTERVVVEASVGEPIDVASVAKKFKTAEVPKFEMRDGRMQARDPYAPFSSVTFRLTEPRAAVTVFSSGKLHCSPSPPQPGAEDLAKKAILEVVTQLKQGGIPIRNEPSFEVDVGVQVNFGRGINTHLLPELIPDSLYACEVPADQERGVAPAWQGAYNKGGALTRLTSYEEAKSAVEEIWGKEPTPESRPSMWPFTAYCRLRGSRVVAQMNRNVVEGKEPVSGYAHLTGISGEAQVQESVRILEGMLEQAQVFTPLATGPVDYTPPSQQPLTRTLWAYCSTCKASRAMSNPKKFVPPKGGPVIVGNCASCGKQTMRMFHWSVGPSGVVMTACPSCKKLVEVRSPQVNAQTDQPGLQGICASCGRQLSAPGGEPDEPPILPLVEPSFRLPPNQMIGPFGTLTVTH